MKEWAKIIFLCGGCFLLYTSTKATSAPPSSNLEGIGRYQVSTSGKDQAVLLDTVTGKMWEKGYGAPDRNGIMPEMWIPATFSK